MLICRNTELQMASIIVVFAEEDKITYYPSREAQWEQHVFEEMLVWGNDNLHSGRIIVPLG